MDDLDEVARVAGTYRIKNMPEVKHIPVFNGWGVHDDSIPGYRFFTHHFPDGRIERWRRTQPDGEWVKVLSAYYPNDN
jgi:hypothetical protein